MSSEDQNLRERLVTLRFRRDELAKEAADLHRRLSIAGPILSPEKAEKLALLLREQLHHGPPELRQAYARIVLSKVRVRDREIRISGSKAILARSAAEGLAQAAPAVLSFVQEWRPRQDSNLRPSD